MLEFLGFGLIATGVVVPAGVFGWLLVAERRETRRTGIEAMEDAFTPASQAILLYLLLCLALVFVVPGAVMLLLAG